MDQLLVKKFAVTDGYITPEHIRESIKREIMDKRCDKPFLGSDFDPIDSGASRLALQRHYDAKVPYQPDLFIGEDEDGSRPVETDMPQMKAHSEVRSRRAAMRFTDSNDKELMESPWSYASQRQAIKDIQTRLQQNWVIFQKQFDGRRGTGSVVITDNPFERERNIIPYEAARFRDEPMSVGKSYKTIGKPFEVRIGGSHAEDTFGIPLQSHVRRVLNPKEQITVAGDTMPNQILDDSRSGNLTKLIGDIVESSVGKQIASQDFVVEKYADRPRRQGVEGDKLSQTRHQMTDLIFKIEESNRLQRQKVIDTATIAAGAIVRHEILSDGMLSQSRSSGIDGDDKTRIHRFAEKEGVDGTEHHSKSYKSKVIDEHTSAREQIDTTMDFGKMAVGALYATRIEKEQFNIMKHTDVDSKTFSSEDVGKFAKQMAPKIKKALKEVVDGYLSDPMEGQHIMHYKRERYDDPTTQLKSSAPMMSFSDADDAKAQRMPGTPRHRGIVKDESGSTTELKDGYNVRFGTLRLGEKSIRANKETTDVSTEF
jgi:hypothetical protein